MIRYFQKDLKPSIKVEMKQQDREFVNFQEMILKDVNAKAKAGLRSTILVQDSDIYCSQGYCPSNNTASKVQTQGTTTKDFSYLKEPKTKDLKSVPLCDNPAEPAKKKDKQKRFKQRQKCTRQPKKIPATGDNTVNVVKKKKKRDTSKVMCFTYIKKGHYTSNYTKPKN